MLRVTSQYASTGSRFCWQMRSERKKGLSEEHRSIGSSVCHARVSLHVAAIPEIQKRREAPMFAPPKSVFTTSGATRLL